MSNASIKCKGANYPVKKKYLLCVQLLKTIQEADKNVNETYGCHLEFRLRNKTIHLGA